MIHGRLLLAAFDHGLNDVTESSARVVRIALEVLHCIPSCFSERMLREKTPSSEKNRKERRKRLKKRENIGKSQETRVKNEQKVEKFFKTDQKTILLWKSQSLDLVKRPSLDPRDPRCRQPALY